MGPGTDAAGPDTVETEVKPSTSTVAWWRERHNAQAQASPEAVEAALMAEVERADRGELSGPERIALADKLTNLVMDFQHRAIKLSRIGFRLQHGREHPLPLQQ
jgi:hypothetical protein